MKWRLIPGGVLILCLAAGIAPVRPAHAQLPQTEAASPVSVQVSPQLFATMCALYAAGLSIEARALDADPAFISLFAQLRQLQGPATEALREYYRDHALGEPSAILSRYVSFALVAGPPPAFSVLLPREELPPEVLTLDGFSVILANFYREAQIERRWRQLQPTYERLASQLQEPLGRIVLTETSYLRELLRRGSRTFTVYPEPLLGARTDFRNIGDRYFVVLNPAMGSNDEIRHAFLHFLVDPLPFQYRDLLTAQVPLQQIAARAPRLPAELRNDLSAFFTECLVRAIDLRLRRLTGAELAGEVDSAETNGYVLIRPLVTALEEFEASEPAMRFYFPALVRSIDTAKEEERLQTVTFAPASQVGADPGPKIASESSLPASLSLELQAALTEGQRFIAALETSAAAAAFERVLEEVPGYPQALYGLAVASILQGNAAGARTLFEQVVAAGSSPEDTTMRPNPNALAWSHVYLARMYDFADSREEALIEYRAALAVADASEAARVAAQNGIEQGYRPAVRNPAPE